MILHKYDDPGHGWLKVPRKTLVKLDLIKKVSSCSYQRGDYVYLEEDADMSLLWNALEARGETLTYHTHIADKRSKIRSYASFAQHIND